MITSSGQRMTLTIKDQRISLLCLETRFLVSSGLETRPDRDWINETRQEAGETRQDERLEKRVKTAYLPSKKFLGFSVPKIPSIFDQKRLKYGIFREIKAFCIKVLEKA